MNCCFKNPRVTLSSPSVYVKLRQRVWGEWGIFHVTQKCSHALLSISIAHYTHFNRRAQTWQQLNIYYTSIQPSGLCENTLSLQKHLFCLSYKPWLLYDLWRGWHGFKRSWCLWSLLLVYIWLPEMLSVNSLLDLCLHCPFIVGRHLYCFVMLCTSCRYGQASYESCWCILRYQTGSQIFCNYSNWASKWTGSIKKKSNF